MNCGSKIKQKCGVQGYSTCIKYEKEVSDWSPLSNEDCLSLEDTVGDLYDEATRVREEIDLSELGQQCLTYVPNGQVAKVKDILIKYEEEICSLKEQVMELQTTAICDMSVESCGIDLTGLEDSCNNPIQNLSQLLSYLLLHSNP